jgi:cytochrome P450
MMNPQSPATPALADLKDPPSLNIDPFSDEVLRDPYPFHDVLRETAPVVWLEQHGIYAVGRYNEIGEVLQDHTRFTAAGGVGMSDIRKPGAWRSPSPISEIDPPAHTSVRAALTKVISPLVIRKWRDEFQKEADRVASQVVERELVDGVRDIAEAFVLHVFPKALGIDIPKDNFIAIGDMNFNQLGPNNERLRHSMERVKPIMAWYEESFQRHRALPGGFAEQIFLAEDSGEFPVGTAPAQVRSFLRAGVDTTMAGIGHTLHHLARNPEQWAIVRADPSKVRGAFEEALRFESPSQTMFRTTVEDTHLSGYRLQGDKKVAMFFGAGNRDPRKWDEPNTYAINRVTAGVHLSFGGGVHICIGQMIARLEAEAILGAIAKRAQNLELAGEPAIRLVNTLRTLDHLPLKVTAA